MINNELQGHFGIITIIAANLLPLFFVITGRADVFVIVLLYWMESVVIGIFNALKMGFAGGRLGHRE